MQQVSSTWSSLASANGQDMMAAMEEAEAAKARVLYGDMKQADVAAAAKSRLNAIGGPMELLTRAMRAPPPPPELEKAMELFGSDIMGSMGTSGSSLFGKFGGLGMGGGFGNGSSSSSSSSSKKSVKEAVSAAVEHFKDRKRLRELVGWLASISPELVGVLLNQRDEHMYRELAGLAGAVGQLKGGGLHGVAVVGVAHMDGIEKRWAEDFGPGSVQPID
jgi:pheromone shutdown protein TraB